MAPTSTPPSMTLDLPPNSGGALAGRGITGITINVVIGTAILNK
jgi:hypothetical protein